MNTNKKCKGCGSYLTNELNQPGYTPKTLDSNTNLCQRCFKIKNYNVKEDFIKIDQKINDVLKDIDFTNLHIMMVLDIFDLEHTIIDELTPYQSQITFVINKIDLLPKSYNVNLVKENVLAILQKHGFKNPQILFCSIKSNSSLKNLNEIVQSQTEKRNKSIFFGRTNVGKSSLINGLLMINKLPPVLTTSSFINTSTNILKIKIRNSIVLDTPGVLFPENILNYVNNKDNSKVVFKKTLVRNFYLAPQQTIMLNKLVYVSYLSGAQTNFSFYVNEDVNFKRMQTKYVQKNLANELLDNELKVHYATENIRWKTHTFILNPNKKHNINIAGLGLISINSEAREVSVSVHEGVGVKLSSHAII
ncbi:GTPase RsgA [Ureaplasma zalophigenitalium]|uniref:GTPase RsgA n=1 Tax=Ureaplasma zalophigenitalium TaxID=907723 RepID=A0ABT3BP99_9BACT|nr:GTPase RsgA [Ureaplasma zalophigenitalium]MCV3754088.1 GTPase RsgA [Ureaplasma zalophigenitalium]